MKILILILFITACGKKESQARCYNKTEAKMMCMSNYLQSGYSSMQADIYCAPYYVSEMCYDKPKEVL